MLEKKIEDLTAAVVALTTLLTAAASTPVGMPLVTKPPKAAKPVEKPAEEPAAGPSKEEASKAVEELLKANKRKEAIALLAEFKAKAVSQVPAADYEAFIAKANEILLAA